VCAIYFLLSLNIFVCSHLVLYIVYSISVKQLVYVYACGNACIQQGNTECFRSWVCNNPILITTCRTHVYYDVMYYSLYIIVFNLPHILAYNVLITLLEISN